MASVIKVFLIGNLTKDPELKQTASGISVLSFTIAVDRHVPKDAEKKTDFIGVVAWRQTAELVSRYFKKGKPIFVCGSIQTRNYTDNQGNKRFATEVVADEVGFVESKSDSQSDASQYVPDAYSQPQFEPVSEDGDLPF